MAENSLPQNRGHRSWGFLEAKGSDGDLALAELLGLLHLHLVEPGLLEGLAQGGIHSPVVLAGNPRLLTILLRRYRGWVTWSREEFKPEKNQRFDGGGRAGDVCILLFFQVIPVSFVHEITYCLLF